MGIILTLKLVVRSISAADLSGWVMTKASKVPSLERRDHFGVGHEFGLYLVVVQTVVGKNPLAVRSPPLPGAPTPIRLPLKSFTPLMGLSAGAKTCAQEMMVPKSDCSEATGRSLYSPCPL